MLTKRCLSVVMVALLVQPQLLVCGDDLDQKDEGQEQVDAEKAPVVTDLSDEALKLNSASNESVAQRKTEVTLPGGISLITDDKFVQRAIGVAILVVVALGGYQYYTR